MPHNRGIGTHVVLPRIAADERQSVAHLEGIGLGVLGDDIDGAAHGICTEEG